MGKLSFAQFLTSVDPLPLPIYPSFMLGNSKKFKGQDALSSVQMFAAGVFSSQPDALLSLLGKSSKKLQEGVQVISELLRQIDQALQSLQIPPEPVRDLASLKSAKASVMQMELDVYRPELSEEYKEFSGNLDRFLQQATALKGDGKIKLTRD